MSFVQGHVKQLLNHTTLFVLDKLYVFLLFFLFRYYKCDDPIFLHASITQQINTIIEFGENKDILSIEPAPISTRQYLNDSPEADVKNIVLVLSKIG